MRKAVRRIYRQRHRCCERLRGSCGTGEWSDPASTPVSVKDRSQRLSFKNMGTMAAERILGGQTALGPSGSAVVAQSFEGYPVALGRFHKGYSMCYR